MTATVNVPPFVIRSITKSQPTTAEISLINGKRKRRWSSHAAARISSQSARRDHDQWWNEPPTPCQPNQEKRSATKIPHAITEAKAKIPAASVRPRRRSACAIA